MSLRALDRFFGHELALDPGSAYVRALACRNPNEARVVAVPSVLARLERGSGAFLRSDLAGDAAKALAARTGAGDGSGAVTVVRPISRGAVTDIAAAERLFAHVLGGEAPGRGWGARPRVIAGVGAGQGSVEQRALIEAREGAGAKSVRLVPGLVACAAALEHEAAGDAAAARAGRLVIELGAERTGVGVASRSVVATRAYLPLGFADIDAALAGALCRRGISVSPAEATRLREGLGLPAIDSPAPAPGPLADAEDVLPGHVGEAVAPFLRMIADLVRGVLARAPEGVIESVIDSRAGSAGVDEGSDATCAVLAGGPAATPGLAEFLAADLGVPVRVARDAASLRVRGLALLGRQGSGR